MVDGLFEKILYHIYEIIFHSQPLMFVVVHDVVLVQKQKRQKRNKINKILKKEIVFQS